MRATRSWFLFGLLLAGAALFIWLSGTTLPNLMASHFSATGQADGVMARRDYLLFMMVVVVGAPLAIALLAALANRLYVRLGLRQRTPRWSPEFQAQMLAFLDSQAIRFAALLALFLCFVHWLVVKAHAVQPPRMDVRWLAPGAALFIVAAISWAIVYYVRFRKSS